MTPEQFHEDLHTAIDKPVLNYRKKWVYDNHNTKLTKVANDNHRARWAEATVNLDLNIIRINVYLNFKQNDLKDYQYKYLKRLAREGIRRYWSRSITVRGMSFLVTTTAFYRVKNSIPVDLYVETDPTEYERSMNPAILGIDASFIYNDGYWTNIPGSTANRFGTVEADNDFKYIAAHEFGHSVLMYAGGIFLSWGHKGTTNSILQKAKKMLPITQKLARLT